MTDFKMLSVDEKKDNTERQQRKSMWNRESEWDIDREKMYKFAGARKLQPAASRPIRFPEVPCKAVRAHLETLEFKHAII